MSRMQAAHWRIHTKASTKKQLLTADDRNSQLLAQKRLGTANTEAPHDCISSSATSESAAEPIDCHDFNDKFTLPQQLLSAQKN
ncbi:hypothetical protein [Chamaesiphon sp. OTE_75_metabat_556]|uniref:hypothetical protein n=1 Tax=Chamaesiphon sp. OTE_75_metabat_556 TaxID=2964692 RepID=UPI00286D17A2|nr:hypothetical protein [Chamaesiphon sp. OTE_75_metabat_556]